MSQRDSGYERKERDCYETPEWVTEALRPHVRHVASIWEPAAGSGKVVKVFEGWGLSAIDYGDIADGRDFLQEGPRPIEAIVTNPPYALATQFIEHALKLMRPTRGTVAMLLRTDFDRASSRSHLFECRSFSRKVVLRKRIRWFADSKGSPSFNHAWFTWNGMNTGLPTLAYGP